MAEHESIIYELQVRGAGAAGSAVDALNRRFATLGQNLKMTSQAAAQAAAGSRLPFFQKSGRTMVGGISHLPASIKAIYKDAGANGTERSHKIGFASASDALAARNKLRDANKNRVGAQIAHYMMDRGSSQMWSALSDPYEAERDARGKHLSAEHIKALRILNRERREQSLRERRSKKDINRMKYEGTTAIVPYVDKSAEAEAKARKEKEFAESQARWAAKRREILMEAKQRRKDILLSLGKWAAGPKMSRFLTATGLSGNLSAVGGSLALRGLKWLLYDNPSKTFARDMNTYVSASRAGVSASEASALGWASRVYGGDAKSASALFGNLVRDLQGALVGRGLGRLGDAALRYGLDITGSGPGGLPTLKELLPRIANLLAKMNDQQKAAFADTLGLQESEFMLLKDGWAKAKRRIDEANKNNPFNDPVYIKTMEQFQQSKTDLQTQWDKTSAELAKGYGGWLSGAMDWGKKGLEWLSYLPKVDHWMADKWWSGVSGAWVPDFWEQSKGFFGDAVPYYLQEGTKWVDQKVGELFPDGWGATPDTNVEHLRFPEASSGSYYNAPSMTITPTFNNTFNVNGNLDQSAVPELRDEFKGTTMPFFKTLPQTILSSPTR